MSAREAPRCAGDAAVGSARFRRRRRSCGPLPRLFLNLRPAAVLPFVKSKLGYAPGRGPPVIVRSNATAVGCAKRVRGDNSPRNSPRSNGPPEGTSTKEFRNPDAPDLAAATRPNGLYRLHPNRAAFPLDRAAFPLAQPAAKQRCRLPDVPSATC